MKLVQILLIVAVLIIGAVLGLIVFVVAENVIFGHRGESRKLPNDTKVLTENYSEATGI